MKHIPKLQYVEIEYFTIVSSTHRERNGGFVGAQQLIFAGNRQKLYWL